MPAQGMLCSDFSLRNTLWKRTTRLKVGMTIYGSTVDADLALLGTRVHVTGKVSDGELMAVIEGLEKATP